MAGAVGKMMEGMLHMSDSQKAFSPWWEDLEGKLLYSLMILGMFTIPFNMVANTPIQCTLDRDDPHFNDSMLGSRAYFGDKQYFNKYCTVFHVREIVVLLPFLLIFLPLPLVAIGKVFMNYFRVEKRLNSFYSLLVKESLDREDVEQMERENMKDCHEILQMFRNSKGVTKYLVTRAVVQLSVGILLCALLIWIYLYHLMGPEIKCTALGMHHSCIVPLSSFYYAVLMGSMLASHGFLACCIYKLIWIAFVERMSPFAKLMRRKRNYIDKCIKYENSSKDVRPVFTKILPCSDGTAEPFFDVYHSKESPDFGLLVTMLATRNGIAEGLRILTLFDKEYQKLWRPGAIAIYHGSVPNNICCKLGSERNGSELVGKNDVEQQEKHAVTIVWTDAPIAPFIDSYCTNSLGPLRMEYTVEIVPNKVAEAPLKSHLYHSDKSKLFFQFDEGDFDKNYNTANPSKHHNEINEYSETFFSPILSKCDLKDLKKDDKSGKEEKIDLKIVISTEINGRTIAQTSEKIPPPPRPNHFE